MGDTDPTPGEITRSLARIESRLDKVLDDHEQRLRRIEKWVYAIPPTVVLAGATVLAALFR